MSRKVSATILSAIQDQTTTRMVVKAIVDPSRTYFSGLSDDFPFDAADYSLINETPVGQCALYDTNTGDMYTFVIDAGTIYGMIKGSATKNNLSLTADNDTKPSAYALGNGSAHLYYFNGTDLKRSTINLSSWAVSGTITLTVDNLPSSWNVDLGSPHVFNETQVGFIYKTTLGGLGCAFYDGSQWNHWENRFVSPNFLTGDDWSIYSAAVFHNGKTYFYSTDFDTGEVRGVEYNNATGLWSDSFIALPSDLTRFCITNAISTGGYIHMAGQFHRTDDLVNAKIYSLVLRSTEGKIFSWDRFTLLSDLGFQFNISPDVGGKVLWASDRNSIGNANMSYFFTAIPIDRIVLQPPSDIVSFEMASVESGSLELKSYDESYYDNPFFDKGNRIQIHLGYRTTEAGYEYTQYAQFIIDASGRGVSEGVRHISLSLRDEGTWKTSQIAFPFYAEIISKSTLHDDADERDNMYPVATQSLDVFDFFYIDFWNNEEWDGDGALATFEPYRFRHGGPGASRKGFSNSNGATDQKSFRTVELNEHPWLDDYPTVGLTTVSAKLFGWERTTTGARANSDWRLYLVTAPEDDLDNKTITAGTLSSTYDQFPQEDPDNESGSYPIEYDFTGLTVGDVILYIGVTIQNTVVGGSTAAPERLEMTGVSFVYNINSSSRGWELSNPDPSTYDRDYLELPETGIPSILFTTKPYTAFKFSISAQFIYIPGDDPISVGTTAWGVVGLAKDGADYICARYFKQGSRVQLLSNRGTVETELATYVPATQPEDIRLEHRDGQLTVWIRETGNTWTGPVITHQWDEIADGVMSTSGTGIMHTGIYAAIAPPGFITPSFNVSDQDGVAITTAQMISILNAFPTSGQIRIDGTVYDYTGKTTQQESIGPYQARQSENYRAQQGAPAGWATEIALYWPDSSNSRLKGLLLAAENGHTWQIDFSDWTVIHSTKGVANPLPNRSRHYTITHGGNVVGTNHRMYITPGLSGLEQAGGGPSLYHTFGSWVTLHGSDKIWVKDVVATTVDHDSTVGDMIRALCRAASVETEFPGDWETSSLSIGTTPVALAASEPLLPGGYDVYFTIPALADTQWIALYADNLLLGDGAETIDIGFKNNSGTLEVFSLPSGTETPEYLESTLDPTIPHKCRILFHDQHVSIYMDDYWVATFSYSKDDLVWPAQDDVNLWLYASNDSHTVTDILVTELFDWREAIYVESEMSSASALGSVIQERPIEVSPRSNGELSFSYKIIRDRIILLRAAADRTLHRHTRTDKTNQDAGSDAVVYFSDVGFVSNSDFAKHEGFLTRVFKLSGLSTGAEAASRILLEKAYERQKTHNIRMRPDVRLETGDIFEVNYIVPGTDRDEQAAMIVERIGMSIREGEYVMHISGREDNEIPRRDRQSAYLDGV